MTPDVTVVLTDGEYRIEWNGSCTFNVYHRHRALSAFTIDHELTITEEQARTEAAEWWTEGGKAGTQEAVRATTWR